MRYSIKLNPDFPFDLYRTSAAPEFPPILHCHDCLEINYVERGTGRYLIENREFPMRPGDIFIINNLEYHMAATNGDLSLVVMVFEPSILYSVQNECRYMEPFYQYFGHVSSCISADNPAHQELVRTIQTIDREWAARKKGYQMVIHSSLMYLAAMLYRYHNAANSSIEGIPSAEGIPSMDGIQFHKPYQRIRPAIEYINSHFKEEITLEQVAKAACLSKSYITSAFKKVMNRTIFEYVDYVRISYACILLTSGGMSVTEAAMECGYSSSSYFTRVFKKVMGVAPKEYSENPGRDAST